MMLGTYSYPFSCKGCTERHPGCHATCETYKRERAEYEKQKAKRDKYKEAQIYMNNSIAAKRNYASKVRKEHRGYRRMHHD